jgi:hypothetical protein
MSKRLIQPLLVAVAVLLSAASAVVADEHPLRLTLPAEMYAVVGVDMNVYFDNVVLTETPEDSQSAALLGSPKSDGGTSRRRLRMSAAISSLFQSAMRTGKS